MRRRSLHLLFLYFLLGAAPLPASLCPFDALVKERSVHVQRGPSVCGLVCVWNARQWVRLQLGLERPSPVTEGREEIELFAGGEIHQKGITAEQAQKILERALAPFREQVSVQRKESGLSAADFASQEGSPRMILAKVHAFGKFQGGKTHVVHWILVNPAEVNDGKVTCRILDPEPNLSGGQTSDVTIGFSGEGATKKGVTITLAGDDYPLVSAAFIDAIVDVTVEKSGVAKPPKAAKSAPALILE